MNKIEQHNPRYISPRYLGRASSEEEPSFFDLIFNRDVDRRSANTWSSGSSLGSEFLGKRRKRVPTASLVDKRAPGSEFLGKRAPGSEFLGKRAPGSEFLGKRAPGSEFLGKRAPGSEFLGKRAPGSEFLGKRAPGSEFLGKRAPGSEFLGKRAPGSEFLGKRAPGSEFLGKRAPGSEFLGKRAPGSEFLGKRSSHNDAEDIALLRYLHSLKQLKKRSPEVPTGMLQSDRDHYWGRLHKSLKQLHRQLQQEQER